MENNELAICFHIHHCGATATRPCVARNFAEAVKARRAAARKAVK